MEHEEKFEQKVMENPDSSSLGIDYETGRKFIHSVMDQVDGNKVEGIICEQREALSRFEKTNEMLSNCCSLSAARLEHARRELGWYTQMMGDMKKDLDSIFRRLRLFKNRITQLYPEAFAEAMSEGNLERNIAAASSENRTNNSNDFESSTSGLS